MFALSSLRPTEPSEKTFAHQRSLPRLPVPALEPSVDRYLKTLTPLLRDRRDRGLLPDGATVESELARRKIHAEAFLARHGLARKLQARLQDVDRSVPDNWLDDAYWIKAAYHSWRVPLPVNSNWWILMADDPNVPKDVLGKALGDGRYGDWQIRRAAQLTWRFLDFKDRLEKQDIFPDSSRAGPFCMYQYTRVYGVTRIPSIPTDYLAHAPHPHPCRHITVLVRSQVYTLQVLSHDGQPIPASEIESGLWAIVYDLHSRAPEDLDAAVPNLTAGDRDEWARLREHLLVLSPVNRASLTAVEDSLFTVCLEDFTRPSPAGEKPDLDSHIVTASANADGSNRWFDKSLSVIVENNSRGSLSGEHSPCDALIPSIVSDYAQAEGVGPGACDLEAVRKEKASRQAGWQRVRWAVDAKIEQGIENARAVARAIQEDSDGKMLWFDEYGAEWIKKTGKQSPDAYIQMAMQLAWYRQMGRAVATYETASTRLFRRGRTDVIRTLSDASYDWVRSMDDTSSSPKQRYKRLSAATASHNAYTRDASLGKGFDRHFLGLKLVHRPDDDGPLPELMTDELFGESQAWELSTSGLSAGDRFFGTGFGTVWPSGYGVNYLAGAKVIKFGVESKRSDPKTSTAAFCEGIVQAMRDMQRVCAEGQGGDPERLVASSELKL